MTPDAITLGLTIQPTHTHIKLYDRSFSDSGEVAREGDQLCSTEVYDIQLNKGNAVEISVLKGSETLIRAYKHCLYSFYME